MPHQFSRPGENDPWYDAFNLIVDQRGTVRPDEYVVAIAHKDSQSWTDSPDAYDNAAGTAGVLEMVRVLSRYEAIRTLRFVFCNEEHWPWTSEIVAADMSPNGNRVVAVVNVDSIGGKSAIASQAGRQTNVTRYSSPEGKVAALRMSVLNDRYGIGLETHVFRSEHPHDDDGSFVKAGITDAVLNSG